jgi:sec-independent protein translocase protein TatA
MQIFGLGLPELIIIALIVLLFFGKDRLPGLFRSVGTSIKELKDGLTNGTPSDTTSESQKQSGDAANTKQP